MINAEQELEAFENTPWSKRKHCRSEVAELLGKTIVEIDGAKEDSKAIVFLCDDGTKFMMYHEQDCCEYVAVNDICGDVSRLLKTPITKAEEVAHDSEDDEDGSHTWTFYHLATVKGYVTIRWYGESNGYYSEGVDMIKFPSSEGVMANCQK